MEEEKKLQQFFYEDNSQTPSESPEPVAKKSTDEEPKKKISAITKAKKIVKKAYHFLWVEESFLSYTAFIILSYLFLRFMLFPSALYITGYSDVAAVITGSMTHKNELISHTFYDWLEFYNITEEEYSSWDYQSGFNIGDVLVAKEVDSEKIEKGDIILFYYGSKQIVHRVVSIEEFNGEYFFTTKGDANGATLDFERNIPSSQIKGKVVGIIPYLGYPKYLATIFIPFI